MILLNPTHNRIFYKPEALFSTTLECVSLNAIMRILAKIPELYLLLFPAESCNIYYLRGMSIAEFVLTFHPEWSSQIRKNMFFNEQNQEKRD